LTVLYSYVPKELLEREKAGLSILLAAWLRTDLRDWAEDLLDERKLNMQGYFDMAIVRSKWPIILRRMMSATICGMF